VADAVSDVAALEVRCRRRRHLLATAVHDDDDRWWLDVTRWGSDTTNKWAGTPARIPLAPPGSLAFDRMGCACGVAANQSHKEIRDAIKRGDRVLLAY